MIGQIGPLTRGQVAIKNQPQTMRFRGGLEAPIRAEAPRPLFDAIPRPPIPSNGFSLGNIFGWVNYFQFTKILLALWQMQMRMMKMILDSVLSLTRSF